MSRLPDPLAGDGVVTHDPVSRSLLVKAKAGDRVWPLWRRGHEALLSDSGSFYGPPSVYASGAGRYQDHFPPAEPSGVDLIGCVDQVGGCTSLAGTIDQAI